MENTHLLHILDDNGIIGIANVTRYNETLAYQDEWTWRQLNEFLLQRNNGNLIIFSTGCENEWGVRFLIGSESQEAYFQKLEQNIEVTDGFLHLVSWGCVTCTLQFEDTTLPGFLSQDLMVPVPNGHYRAILKQLADPEDDEANAALEAHFIVELHRCAPDYKAVPEELPWSDYFPNDDRIFLSND